MTEAPFELISQSPEQTQAIGLMLAGLLAADDVLLLCGDLGAGKTELAKGVARGLGVEEPVNSPTFNLLLVHELPAGTQGATQGDSPFGLAELDATQGDSPFGLTELSSSVNPKGLSPWVAAAAPHSLYHFDLYRLDASEQLDDIDYFAMLEDGAVSLVEWGDRFADALPRDYLQIEMSLLADGARRLLFTASGSRSQALLAAWRDAWQASGATGHESSGPAAP